MYGDEGGGEGTMPAASGLIAPLPPPLPFGRRSGPNNTEPGTKRAKEERKSSNRSLSTCVPRTLSVQKNFPLYFDASVLTVCITVMLDSGQTDLEQRVLLDPPYLRHRSDRHKDR